MKPIAMDSLEFVEMVMWVEEFLELEIDDEEAKRIDSPREVVDLLERKLANTRPNKAARFLLQKLAQDQQWPELAEGFDRPWRREQIAALVREILRDRAHE